jgi:dipeptidyl aminopeptidase/acylaminoacyl peptidase
MSVSTEGIPAVEAECVRVRLSVERDPHNLAYRHQPANVMPRVLFVILLTASFVLSAPAQERYQVPDSDLATLVEAPAPPATALSPDRSVMVVMERPSVPELADLAAPEQRLAGIRFNPANMAPSRATGFTSITLVDIATGERREVGDLPADLRARNLRWAAGSRWLAFTHDSETAVHLYILDVARGVASRIEGVHVNDAYIGSAVTWLPDASGLIVRAVPQTRDDAPMASPVPTAPIVQENIGRTAPARTYQDLLADQHDEALFDHYMTSEIVEVRLDGSRHMVAAPDVHLGAAPSPDGRYILLETTRRPYSYLVPAFRFGRTIDVVDRDGNRVHRLADLGLADEVPTGFGSVPTGVRNATWRNDADATLVWVEALDGGDARAEVAERDRVFMLPAPFDAAPLELTTLADRYAGIQWGEGFALVSDAWMQTRSRKTFLVDPDNPAAGSRLLFDLNTDDRYADPGFPVMRQDERGQSIIESGADSATMYLTGSGASPEGDRPFLREFNLETGETTEHFRSEAPHFETFVAITAFEPLTIITQREAPVDPPNIYMRNLADGSITKLTDFPHPYPEYAGVQRERITYDREDGVQLTATLYLPEGYDPQRDGPLPGLVWAYPREFISADAAGQVTGSPYQFTRVSYWGAVPFAVRGYAVFDGASMPIVGEGEDEPNDTFVDQLIMNARAVIDEGVRRGVLDPDRVAIAGHSYGAFMTANLLAHSDLFKAGIARSGAYNRTLTPFGFQREERTLWEAPEIYSAMSPFMHADKVEAPILLIHGADDNNSGTFPMQSERFYNALRGHGKTARLVMLPLESHGYSARESLLHMLWETDRWLETYLGSDVSAAADN